VALSPGRALVVLVFENGMVENRLIEIPIGLPQSALVEAGNFMAHHLIGKSIADARQSIRREMTNFRGELDQLTARVVDAGIASYVAPSSPHDSVLIMRGGSNLLDSITAAADLDRIRHLLSVLESREAYDKLLDAAEKADGMQIFIGSDNELFALAGCSMIVAPLRDPQKKVIGTLGVIGPARMNYGRIIPMVDYTAKLMTNMLQQNQTGEVVYG
jgi:heat-inducible transcriptional repressor